MKNFKKSLNLICIVFLITTQFNFLFAQENFQAKPINEAGQKTDTSNREEKNYVPWEILVKFKPSKLNLKSLWSKSTLKSFGVNNNLQTKDTIDSRNIAIFKIENNQNFDQKLNELNNSVDVEYAEPNYIYRTSATTFNDPYTGNLRALPKIDRYEGYEMFSGNVVTTWTVVAVVDAWVAHYHPDLATNMWNGSSCKDDAGAALNNCVHGYDFADNDLDPFPVRSDHGTHVAGTIAAAANNGSWIIGINPHAQIMAIRVWDDSMTLENIIRWIDFARQNGAKIINASFGGRGYSTWMYDAINAFRSAWWLFIAAAWNGDNYDANGMAGDNHDTASQNVYPCDYTLDNIICVAATDSSDGIASFSDYWSTSVDLWAPWVSIYSTEYAKNTFTGFRDDFESYATWYTPSTWMTGWSSNNRWILNIWWWRQNVFFSDMAYPYANNTDTFVQTGKDLSVYSGATVSFWALCDTQYNTSSWTDYMSLEMSSNGVDFTWLSIMELGDYRRDEVSLDDDYDVDNNTNSPLSWTYMELSADIPRSYLTNNFTLRFRWTSNGSDNIYNGCLIDDVNIEWYTPSSSIEPYWYKNGTSMATPHVAWLTSLARSARPWFSYTQIRNIIINSWDLLVSLSGKTVSGKRINTENVLIALGYDNSPRSSIYTTIASLLSGQWIVNNLAEVNWSNVNNFSWLYFAKISWSQELGRITFATGLDLTTTGTQEFLSWELASSLWISQWQIRFNPWTGFQNKNAILKMNLPISFSWIISSFNAWSFLVRVSSGWAVTWNSMITSISSWACTNFCPVYIAVSHFTSFELRPQLLQVNIKSNNTNTSYAKSWDIVTLSWTWSEALTWVTATINGWTWIVSWATTSRYTTFTVTWWTANTGIVFSINYQNLSWTTWNTLTSTRDFSAVRVDTLAPVLSGAASVTNTTTQTPSYSFSSNQTWTISYSWWCTSSTTSAISWTNTISFSTMSNATYSWCRIYVTDSASNQSYIVVPTFTVNYSAWWWGGWGWSTTTPITTPNPDLDNFVLSTDDNSPDQDQRVDLGIKARKSNNSLLTNYTWTVEFKIYYKTPDSSTWTRTSSSSYYEIKSWYTTGYKFTSSNAWQVTIENFIRFFKDEYSYKVFVEDEEEDISQEEIFEVGIDQDEEEDEDDDNEDEEEEADDEEEEAEWSITDSPFSTELNQAYQYAYQIWITTMNTVQKANMTWTLQRSHLAKMIVNYAQEVLNRQADTTKTCNFWDIWEQNTELRWYIKTACQMGLMGVGLKNFYPKNKVTRAEFGTILSRALRWNDNDGAESDYYSKHLKALKYNGVMTKIDDPWSIEIRGWVMLMLMRAKDKQ